MFMCVLHLRGVFPVLPLPEHALYASCPNLSPYELPFTLRTMGAILRMDI